MNLSIGHISKRFPECARSTTSPSISGAAKFMRSWARTARKSTLIKIITGVHRPDSGRLTLDGRPVEFASPRESLCRAIGVVHQERNLIPRFSVGENILLERLPSRGVGRL